jgi:hypothetical protein
MKFIYLQRLLREMVANYAEYSEAVGVIDVPADFDPVAGITGGN